jgi:hypothetical protein
MHYFFMTVIVAYLVGFVFLHQKKYLEINEPVADLRMMTMGPCQPKHASDLCSLATPAKMVPAVGENCTRAFQCNQHPYCTPPDSSAAASSAVGGKAPCVFWDHNGVTWPPSERNALTIATRVSIYEQKLTFPNGTVCAPPAGTNPGDPAGLPSRNWDCQYMPSIVSGQSYDAYVADIANFTISIAQDVTATSLPISANGMAMKGTLLKCKEGTKCDYNTEDDFKATKAWENTNTIFTVHDLLDAVVPHDHKGTNGLGLDLDAQSDACPTKCVSYSTGKHLKSTNRWMGFTILLDVQYDNTGTLISESSFNDVRYRIRAYRVADSTFRVEVPYYQAGNTRIIHHLHGPRIVVMTKGKLGQADFNTVVIQLTTSIALLALANLVVDFILMHFMRARGMYQQIKFMDDEDAIRSVADSQEEKDALLKQHKEEAGIDYHAMFTCGIRSDPTIDSKNKPQDKPQL